MKQLKHIVIVGPESCGKTTLASALATEFSTEWVPEYLREFYDRRNGIIREDDVKDIVDGQMRLAKEKAAKADEFLFWDTNPLQTLVYQKIYFASVPAWLDGMISRLPADFYLLLVPDFPWVPDPQREMQDKREEIHNLIEAELKGRNLNFVNMSAKSGAEWAMRYLRP